MVVFFDELHLRSVRREPLERLNRGACVGAVAHVDRARGIRDAIVDAEGGKARREREARNAKTRAKSDTRAQDDNPKTRRARVRLSTFPRSCDARACDRARCVRCVVEATTRATESRKKLTMIPIPKIVASQLPIARMIGLRGPSTR